MCFVTGPNMAGKSTFLKAVAIAVLLAQAGCGVPASSMEFAPAGAIFSSVNIVDNVNAGESFYLAEVRRIAALARALHENGSVLAIVDEPFRGTNVPDAAEATLAIVYASRGPSQRTRVHCVAYRGDRPVNQRRPSNWLVQFRRGSFRRLAAI